jgi:hypothetical protein
MAKKNKIIPISILSIFILGGLIYYCGFIHSFRDYGKGGNWKPITEYQFQMSKETTEQLMHQVVADNKTSLRFADSSYQFSKDGWFTIFIITSTDTTEYIFRFKGDDFAWAKEKYSTILLFSVADKYYDITPTTIKQASKDYLHEKLTMFERFFLNFVKKRFK